MVKVARSTYCARALSRSRQAVYIYTGLCYLVIHINTICVPPFQYSVSSAGQVQVSGLSNVSPSLPWHEVRSHDPEENQVKLS